MKILASVFIALIVILGCESTSKKPALKTLDWNKTAIEQELKIGDIIIVEGLAYNIVDYYLSSRRILPHFTDPPSFAVHVPTLYRNNWSEEIFIPLYNPEQPDVTENPNVPIGSVVCVIFNPKHEEDLMALHEMYPSSVKQETAEDSFKLAGAMAKYKLEFVSDYTSIKKRPHI